MRLLKILFVGFLPLLAACTSGLNGTRDELRLIDCSRQYASHYQEQVPQVSSEMAARALKAAAQWASDRCYLPCSYEMCGAITSWESGRITVYVTTNELWSKDEKTFVIAPEAEVVLSESTFKPLEETLWHSGCRWGAKDCRLGS